ncbi:GDSL esterase/lipase At1g28640-like [Miscanthus floridulus]|uniref:GDSL esterase/lipase At1g28640-like n=1 Tax=Miscanthus floridulus TaxID=154761 RepID=UPI00345A0F8E
MPGNLPIGCTPIILTLYESHSKSDYDEYGCLDKFYDLARYHNRLLRQEVQALQKKYNLSKIAFADYFRPVVEFLQKPAELGFNGGTALVACRGVGGKYNYNATVACGLPGTTTCADPSRALN